MKEAQRVRIFIDGSEAQFGDLINLVGSVYANRYVVEGAQECEYRKISEVSYRYGEHSVVIRPGERLPIIE